MEGKQFIRSLTLKNLLSYGSEGMTIDLQPLNVVIGPNGSGKSNLLEAIRLLQAAPRDLTRPIIDGGGIGEWLWKGEDKEPDTAPERTERLLRRSRNEEPYAELIASVHQDDGTLKHSLRLGAVGEKMNVVSEVVEYISSSKNKLNTLYYDNSGERATIYPSFPGGIDREVIPLSSKIIRNNVEMVAVLVGELEGNQSILSQRNDPGLYPAIAYLKQTYESIRLYTSSFLGRSDPMRKPQRTDLDSTFIEEDGSNIALVLNDLQTQPSIYLRIIDNLKLFYERVEDIKTRVSYGTVQVYFQEKRLRQLIPATRLSDGTLGFLRLLTVLCHPDPPPLVCIEEPELGMHPDILPTIAELLIEASQRTQLIVTTHSDILVSKFTDMPEAVLVCERDDKGSTLRRLDREKLASWLKDYSLGEAWLKGAIGGTRW